MDPTRFRLLYDGQCPFCRREVEWLKKRDRRDQLLVEDIAAPDFRADSYGLTQDQVMGAIHGILPNGRVIVGLEVIREAYRAVGVGWIVAPTGWPGLRWIADRCYRIFARNRVRLGRFVGGRCDPDRCKA